MNGNGFRFSCRGPPIRTRSSCLHHPALPPRIIPVSRTWKHGISFPKRTPPSPLRLGTSQALKRLDFAKGKSSQAVCDVFFSLPIPVVQDRSAVQVGVLVVLEHSSKPTLKADEFNWSWSWSQVCRSNETLSYSVDLMSYEHAEWWSVERESDTQCLLSSERIKASCLEIFFTYVLQL